MRRLLALAVLLLLPAHAWAAYECVRVPNRPVAFFEQANLYMQDLQIITEAVMQTGVVFSAGGCLVTAQGTPNMTLAVAACTIAQHGATASVSAANVTIGTAHPSFPRIDYVSANNIGGLVVTPGSPTLSPVPPTLPESGGFINAILAEVYVPANDTAIGSTQIVDKRACIKDPTASGGGAGTGLSYITKVAEGTLSNEFAMASLATGYTKNTTATGVPTVQAVPIPRADGGTGQTTSPDDNVMVGDGTVWALKALPTCSGGSSALTYNISTNAFGCNTISGGSTPTGTGFRHVTAGTEDAASKLVDTADINANQVTFAKMQQITTDRLLGRDTAATGDVEQLTVGGGIEFTGSGGIQRSALSGDVTCAAGSGTCAVANIPSGTPMAGSALATAIAAPGTPAAGKGSVYVDSTSKNIAVKDDAGVVKHGVQTDTGSANNFLTAISDAGLVSKAQPAFTNLSGTAAVAQGGTGLTVGTSGGVLAYTASGVLASSGALTANLPVIGGGAGVVPTVGTRSGNTTAFVTTTGTQTNGDCVKIDANGNHVANGSSCAGSGAPSTATYITQTADAGLSAEQALSSLATGYMKVTTTTGAITSQATPIPVADGGTGLASGTSGGVLAYTASGTLASSGALTANLPVIGGGAGVAPTVGTRSGNTTAYVTTTGTQTSGDCVKIDANGNHIANGSACGGGTADTVAIVASDVAHATSNTTLSDVTGLLLAISASATEQWEFSCTLLCLSTGVTADFKFGFSVPASATMVWSAPADQGVGMSATTQAGTESTTLAYGGLNGTMIIGLSGVIFSGGTSGNVQLRFAQNASSSQSTNILKGSFCRYRKLVS